MGREIKFRGLRSDGKGWVYGSLIKTIDGFYYIFDGSSDDIKTCWMNIVIPETVGQFTGLKDRNGVEIYENDKVIIFGKTGIVFFNKETACFLLKTKTQTGYQLSSIRGAESIHEQIEVL